MAIEVEGLQGFIDEAFESMQEIDNDFIALEQDPCNVDIINKIFRPVHSLKGTSGFFGLVSIAKFAHRLENLLDQIRNGKILVNSAIIDLLLRGTDYLKDMLGRVQQSSERIELTEEEEKFLSLVEEIKPSDVSGSVQSVVELEKYLQKAIDVGVNISDHSLITDILSKIEKSNQEIKAIVDAVLNVDKVDPPPSANYHLNGIDYTKQLQPLIDVVSSLAEKKALDNAALKKVTVLLEELNKLFKDNSKALSSIDELSSMKSFLDDDLMIGNVEFNEVCNREITTIVELFEASSPSESGDVQKNGETLAADGDTGQKEPEKADKSSNKQAQELKSEDKKDIPAERTKTIRIDQSKLDFFANQIGELYINIDSFNYLKKQMEMVETDHDIMSKFTNTVSSFDEMVETLHDGVMDIRKVPVKTLFQRFPKVIRQLTQTLDKNINFVISGDETVIDKDLLEIIEHPLVHILRNSVDHGVESPSVRKDCGKKEQALLELKAVADENYVYLTISDDGGGIDPKKMQKIAVAKNFLSQSEVDKMSDKELVNLIFKPSFSSAEKVSDVSGRGVGLDVVLSALKECNGTIVVDSKVGEGTTVSIKIPLTKTLVAMEAMIVESQGRIYAINSEDVSTTIEYPDSSIDLFSEDNCFNHNGTIIRIIDIDSFFYPNKEEAPPSNSLNDKKILIINQENKIGIQVNEIFNHQKIVVKDFTNLHSVLRNINGISGYTILGNQDVALIMDMEKIAAE